MRLLSVDSPFADRFADAIVYTRHEDLAAIVSRVDAPLAADDGVCGNEPIAHKRHQPLQLRRPQDGRVVRLEDFRDLPGPETAVFSC